MIWRDFVEGMKDMGESMVAGLRDDRPLTPFFLYANETEAALGGMAIPPAHFQDDERLESLVRAFVIPLVLEAQATRVAWLLNADVRYLRTGGRIDAPECVVLAVFDREVEETWAAPIYRYGDATAIGVWQAWPASQTSSRLIEPVQQAIR